MNKLYVIAPLPSVLKRTRLFKLVNYWSTNFGQNIEAFLWERENNNEENIEFPFIKTRVILKGGGFQSSKARLLYLLWFIKVFTSSFKIKKNDTVWCLGFESAFPAVLASYFKGYKVIYDDADRFSMILNLPKPLDYILRKLEMFVSKKAFKHVVPGYGRYEFRTKGMTVIPNVPSQEQLNLAYNKYLEGKWVSSKLIINVNGWLGDSRGLTLLYEAIKDYDSNNLYIYMSGKLDCEAAYLMSELSTCTYFGEVDNSSALSSYYASDFVFTFYDPSLKINLYAEANKWGDAIKTGTGVIANEELLTLQNLKAMGVVKTCPYDVVGLKQLIEELLDEPSKIDEIKEKSQTNQGKLLSFEEYINKVLF